MTEDHASFPASKEVEIDGRLVLLRTSSEADMVEVCDPSEVSLPWLANVCFFNRTDDSGNPFPVVVYPSWNARDWLGQSTTDQHGYDARSAIGKEAEQFHADINGNGPASTAPSTGTALLSEISTAAEAHPARASAHPKHSVFTGHTF
jgi:hypothetical protein